MLIQRTFIKGNKNLSAHFMHIGCFCKKNHRGGNIVRKLRLENFRICLIYQNIPVKAQVWV